MIIITIGGLPAAGKTYTSKLLAKKYECISLEYEALRWEYFLENVDENLYKYTHYEKVLPNETMRQYYLRCMLYGNKVSLSELTKWHKETMDFINNKIFKIVNEFSLIKDERQYKVFGEKYKNIINYMPNFFELNKKYLICSHAFINTINFGHFRRIKIDFICNHDVLIERFKKRENIEENIHPNVQLYYASYEEVLRKSDAIKVDTTDCEWLKKVTNLLKENNGGIKMDLKIKTDVQEFHGRACGIIKQGDYFLVMRVNKTPYYHIPGGHIEIGEDSKAAIIREVNEEIGCEVNTTRLFAIQENFWIRREKQCHGIEFYYIVEPKIKLPIKDYERIENDKGEEKILEFKWIKSEELAVIDLRPANIKELLIAGKYNNSLVHMIERD